MSNRVGGRDPPPYKYATRKALDHHTDRLDRKLKDLKEDIRMVRNHIRHLIGFLEQGPHAAAYAIYMDHLQEIAERS